MISLLKEIATPPTGTRNDYPFLSLRVSETTEAISYLMDEIATPFGLAMTLFMLTPPYLPLV